MTRAREGVPLGSAALVLGLVVFAGGGFPDSVRALVALPILLVTGLWLAVALTGRSPLPRLGRDGRVAALAAVAMVALAAGSIAWSASGERSWAETNRLLVYIALGVVGALLASARPSVRPLAALVAVVLAAVLGWALLGRVVPSLGPAQTGFGETHRLHGTVGYANGLALLAALAVPLGLWAARERAPRARAAGLTLVVLAFVAAPLTYSRTGLALVAAAAIVWIWRCASRFQALLAVLVAALLAVPAVVVGLAGWSAALFGVTLAAGLAGAALLAPRLERARVAREERVVRSAAVALLGLAGAVLLVLVVRDGGPVAFVQARWNEFAAARQGSEQAGRLASVGSFRWSWWKEAWHGFEQRPVGGHGAGSFALTHLHLRHNLLSQTLAPHSMPLQLLTELGLAGFLLAALGLWAVLRTGRDVVRRATEDREPLFALALVVVLAAVHALVDLDWEILAVDGIPVFVAGALVALAAPRLAVARRRSLGAAAAVIVLLAAVYSVSAPLLAARELDKGLTDPVQAYVSAGVARAYDPLSVQALLRQAQAAHQRGEDDLAHELYLKATRLEPENPSTWQALGLFEWHVFEDVCTAYSRFNRAYTEDPAGAARNGPLDKTRRAVNHGACQ